MSIKNRTMILVLALAGMFALVGIFAAQAIAQNGSNFGNTCDVSDHSNEDPIFGPHHQHIFYGKLNPTSADTPGSIRGEPTTCNRTENSSLYWHPEVYQNNNPTPLAVDTTKGLGDNTIYYRAGDVKDHSDILAFPENLEMVARDLDGEGDSQPGDVKWGCEDGGGLSDTRPTRCASERLIMRMSFPQCYVRDAIGGNPDVMREVGDDGDCVFDTANGPVRHRAIPQITFSVTFVMTSPDVNALKVSGGEGTQEDWRTMHGDFVNGWEMDSLRNLTQKCISTVGDGATTEQKPDFCRDPGTLN